jgi:hypothetical protein
MIELPPAACERFFTLTFSFSLNFFFQLPIHLKGSPKRLLCGFAMRFAEATQ